MADPLITLKDIERIADLASLELTADEKQQFVRQFGDILTYFQQIDAAPVTDVQDHAPDAADHLRDDEPRTSGVDPASFSPYLESGQFKVPKVVE